MTANGPGQASTAERLQRWRAIVGMSRELLELARASEWSEMSEKQRRRQQEIEAFFQGPVPAEIADEVERGIREILEYDDEVMDLGKAGRDELDEAIQTLGQRRRAQSAYTQGY